MKYKRNVVAVATVAAFGLMVTGCSGGTSPGTSTTTQSGESAAVGGEPVQGGDLVVASLPDMIDPYASTSRSNWMVAASVCEGLFENAADLSISEGLAESFEYDGDRTYTIQLRQGVKFHSGAELTAQDVVASLERFRAADAGEQFNGLVDTIAADGDSTVVITTKEPTGAIPALLATPDTGAYILAESFLEESQEEITDLDCTGPYQLDSFTPDQKAVISRFDGYTAREGEPDGATGTKIAYADTVTFVPWNESNTINQIRTGQMHVAPQFASMDQLATYKSDPSLEPVLSEGAGFSLLQFNRQEGPMTDVLLRQAAMNAIDPEAIALQQLGSTEHWEDDSSLFPSNSEWHSNAGSEIWSARSPEKTKELLDEAGYDGTPIRILYRPEQDNYGPLVEQQLEAAGFNVDLQAMDRATYGATRTEPGAWDMFLAGGTAYSDPATVVFLNDDFPGWWDTPEKQAAMDAVVAGADFEERKPEWDVMQQLIWEDLPFVTLGAEPRLAVTSDEVGGYEPTRGTVRGFYNVWLED